uniref:Mitochondrial carrier protein n=1 Tax=Chromera velia CCMP2878 TaxID=1169474 RepID=A0A0G4HAI7_9ALVE|mmetsp:Transcript_43061/g.84902  ORF Transcript_43061/g.84902 Transcript_43061/m.84902 type:complete len:320 (-) Transcript_43061:661-1620(-)|eukprot:Cvel_25542.t1-p1 / transcript=Cvel_25542.t1 / gene=Cvel_25542 / organism=Chromera_velia_CCMP2878 / gene_product=Probable mitochondrial 2-oxodicarboxylate carrier, putative / transcript_product=Probable mitochondrial 2-oxodicarboxylate carrier, putative / location=Cvel_scaffold2907:17191-18147(+) / protein_length=319 / sequence_SO=supercontig / SO=protein_coding / is_pseudo=false
MSTFANPLLLSGEGRATKAASPPAAKKKQGALATLPPITCAAVVTSIAMYPADVIRAICMANPGTKAGQALSSFYQAHGLGGFVKQGLAAEIARASFSRMIKFWLQPLTHQAVFGKSEKNGTAITKGLAGALATIPEVITISPLENLKLAEQLDKEKRFNGIVDTSRHLLRTRGFFGGFYIGYIGMQMRQCLWTGGFFMSLDVFKDLSKNITSHKLTQDVLAGFFAGVFGTTLNCWTDVVRSVIQKKAVADTFDPSAKRAPLMQHVNPFHFLSEAAKVYSAQGIAGLYSGFPIKCVHLGGSGAILAVLVPRFKSMWGVE